jgi:hypothetical protein
LLWFLSLWPQTSFKMNWITFLDSFSTEPSFDP